MTDTDFRSALHNKLETDLLPAWLGSIVVTFDDHLHDVERDQLPMVVYNLRRKSREGTGEIGTDRTDLYTWTMHFYYVDVSDDYDSGDDKRNLVMATLEKKLEENKRLGNFQAIVGGTREYVWDSRVTDVIFDSSGQQEYYSHVSELYLDVDTAKN